MLPSLTVNLVFHAKCKRSERAKQMHSLYTVLQGKRANFLVLLDF